MMSDSDDLEREGSNSRTVSEEKVEEFEHVGEAAKQPKPPLTQSHPQTLLAPFFSENVLKSGLPSPLASSSNADLQIQESRDVQGRKRSRPSLAESHNEDASHEVEEQERDISKHMALPQDIYEHYSAQPKGTYLDVWKLVKRLKPGHPFGNNTHVCISPIEPAVINGSKVSLSAVIRCGSQCGSLREC